MVLHQDQSILDQLRKDLQEEKSTNSILEQELEEWAESIRRQGEIEKAAQKAKKQKAASASSASTTTTTTLIQIQHQQHQQQPEEITPPNTNTKVVDELQEHLRLLEEQLNQYQCNEISLKRQLTEAQNHTEESRLELEISKDQVQCLQQELHEVNNTSSSIVNVNVNTTSTSAEGGGGGGGGGGAAAAIAEKETFEEEEEGGGEEGNEAGDDNNNEFDNDDDDDNYGQYNDNNEDEEEGDDEEEAIGDNSEYPEEGGGEMEEEFDCEDTNEYEQQMYYSGDEGGGDGDGDGDQQEEYGDDDDDDDQQYYGDDDDQQYYDHEAEDNNDNYNNNDNDNDEDYNDEYGETEEEEEDQQYYQEEDGDNGDEQYYDQNYGEDGYNDDGGNDEEEEYGDGTEDDDDQQQYYDDDNQNYNGEEDYYNDQEEEEDELQQLYGDDEAGEEDVDGYYQQQDEEDGGGEYYQDGDEYYQQQDDEEEENGEYYQQDEYDEDGDGDGDGYYQQDEEDYVDGPEEEEEEDYHRQKQIQEETNAVIQLLRKQRVQLQNRIQNLLVDNSQLRKEKTKFEYDCQIQERKVEELENEVDKIYEENQLSDVLAQRQIIDWKYRYEQLQSSYKNLESTSNQKENYYLLERTNYMSKIESLQKTNRDLQQQTKRDQENWDHERRLHKKIVDALQHELDGGLDDDDDDDDLDNDDDNQAVIVVGGGGVGVGVGVGIQQDQQGQDLPPLPKPDPLEGKVISATVGADGIIQSTSIDYGSEYRTDISDGAIAYTSTGGSDQQPLGSGGARRYNRRMSNDTIPTVSEDSVGLFDDIDGYQQQPQLQPLQQQQYRRMSRRGSAASNSGSIYSSNQKSKFRSIKEKLVHTQRELQATVSREQALISQLADWRHKVETATNHADEAQMRVEVLQAYVDASNSMTPAPPSSSPSSPTSSPTASEEKRERIRDRIKQRQEAIARQKQMISQGTQTDDEIFDEDENEKEDTVVEEGDVDQSGSENEDVVDDGDNVEVSYRELQLKNSQMAELTRKNQERVRLLRSKRGGSDDDQSSKGGMNTDASDNSQRSYSVCTSSSRSSSSSKHETTEGETADVVFVGDIYESGTKLVNSQEKERTMVGNDDSDDDSDVVQQQEHYPRVVSEDEAVNSDDDQEKEKQVAEQSTTTISRSVGLDAVPSPTSQRDETSSLPHLTQQDQPSNAALSEDKSNQSTSVVSWLLSKAYYSNTSTTDNFAANQGGEEKDYYQIMYEKEKAAKNELQKEIRSLKAEVSSVEQSNLLLLEVRESAMIKLGTELEERERIIRELEGKLATDEMDLEVRITELQDRHTAQTSAAREEISQLKSEIDTCCSENEQFVEENTSLKSKNEVLSETLREKETRMELLLKLLSEITDVTMCDQVDNITGERKLQELLVQLASVLDNENVARGGDAMATQFHHVTSVISSPISSPRAVRPKMLLAPVNESAQSSPSSSSSSSNHENDDLEDDSAQVEENGEAQMVRNLPFADDADTNREHDSMALNAKFQVLEDEKNSLQREIESLKATVTDLSKQLGYSVERETRANQEVETVRNEKDRLVTDLARVEAQQQEASVTQGVRVTGLNERLLEHASELNAVKGNLARASSEAKRVAAERDSLASRLSEISMELAEAIGRENALVKELEESKGTLLVELEPELEPTSEFSGECGTNKDYAETSLDDTLLREDLQYLGREDISVRPAQFEAAPVASFESIDVVSLKTRIAGLEGKVDNLSSTNMDLEDANARLREANRLLANESKVQQHQLEQTKSQLSDLERALISIESDAQKMNLAYIALKSEKQRIESEMRQTSGANRSIVDGMTNQDDSHANSISSLAVLKAAASDSDNAEVELLERLEDALFLSEDIEFLQRNFSSELVLTLNDNEQEIKRLSADLQALNRSKATTTRVLRHECHDLERDFSTLEEYYAEVEMLMKEFKMKCEQLEKERANVVSQLESCRAEALLFGEMKEEMEDEILLREDVQCLDQDFTATIISKSFQFSSVADMAYKEAHGFAIQNNLLHEALYISEDVGFLQTDYGTAVFEASKVHVRELEEELDGVKLKNEELEEMNEKFSELFNKIC